MQCSYIHIQCIFSDFRSFLFCVFVLKEGVLEAREDSDTHMNEPISSTSNGESNERDDEPIYMTLYAVLKSKFSCSLRQFVS